MRYLSRTIIDKETLLPIPFLQLRLKRKAKGRYNNKDCSNFSWYAVSLIHNPHYTDSLPLHLFKTNFPPHRFQHFFSFLKFFMYFYIRGNFRKQLQNCLFSALKFSLKLLHTEIIIWITIIINKKFKQLQK